MGLLEDFNSAHWYVLSNDLTKAKPKTNTFSCSVSIPFHSTKFIKNEFLFFLGDTLTEISQSNYKSQARPELTCSVTSRFTEVSWAENLPALVNNSGKMPLRISRSA